MRNFANTAEQARKRADRETKQRRSMERKIVAAFVSSAINQGYSISVDNGGDEFEIEKCRDAEGVMQVCMATDEEHLHVHNKDGLIVGMVYFVYGNDGWDCINDYSVNLTELGIMHEPNRIAEELERKHAR